MSFDIFDHRLTSKLARWLSLAMCSTAITLAIDVWPELEIIKWIALVIVILMVVFLVASSWLVAKQVPWRNLSDMRDVVETGAGFFFMVIAVILGVWVA